MTEQTVNDFHKRLTKLAHLQAQKDERVRLAQEMRQRMYEAYVKPYDDEIAALTSTLEAVETSIREDALAWFRETGDSKPHTHLTVRRVHKLVYDKQAVLAHAIEQGHTQVIRTKHELSVRDFENALKDTAFASLYDTDALGGERGVRTETVYVVAMDKLGDLAILDGRE